MSARLRRSPDFSLIATPTLGRVSAFVFSLLFALIFVGKPDADARTLSRKIAEKTEIRDYRVYGETPGQLVAYMKRRPFKGDNGPAMANIRPRYALETLTEKRKDRSCGIKRVDLSIRFIMTLPKSMDATKQSRKTKHVWRSFRAFAQRHEEQHRKIYMKCARDFVKKASKLEPERSCHRLERKVKKLLKAQEKDCDKQHLAFDRREFPRVPTLPLFRQARLEKKKGIPVKHRKRRTHDINWFSDDD